MTRKHNAPVGERVFLFAEEDIYGALYRLPVRIRRFLQYDAPAPFDPIQVEEFFIDHGEEETLRVLQEEIFIAANNDYGQAHPSSQR